MAKMREAVVDATAMLRATQPRAADFSDLDDAESLLVQHEIADARRVLDVYATLSAGNIARRSARSFGHSGLAQSKGFPTPEALIQSLTGSTKSEANKLVRLGSMGSTEQTQWQQPVVVSFAAGGISADAADAIRRGLGEPDEAVTQEQLHVAAQRVIALAFELNADELFHAARQLREELDVASIARREERQRDLRFFKAFTRTDGMVGGSFLLDPEDGGLLLSAIDTVMSPRRGGPRFTDPTAVANAEKLVADPRTNDQLVADTVMEMIRLAVDCDPNTMFGHHRPSVKVLVTERNLVDRRGYGVLEGHPDPICITTVERTVCGSGIRGIRFDDDAQCINVGRDQRLFTARQREGIAARDGGCLAPGCEKPPAYCEAHHINEWDADNGQTNIADGILLCRFHHMNYHANGWKIGRRGETYWLTPPETVDPERKPIAMPSKNRLIRTIRQARLTAGSTSG